MSLRRLETFWQASRLPLEAFGPGRREVPTSTLRAAAAKAVNSHEAALKARYDVKILSAPAEPGYIATRVATLLLHGFVGEIPADFQRQIAADWMNELRGLPAWAVSRAARWWLSAENPRRRQRPVPGDISERAQVEMRVLDFLRYAADEFERVEERKALAAPREVWLTPEQEAERKAAMARLVAKMFPGSHAARAEAERREAAERGEA